MMLNRDPRDANFCPYRTTMIKAFSCIPFIYSPFYLTKCIQGVGFVIIRPRLTGMHILHVLTAAADAN